MLSAVARGVECNKAVELARPEKRLKSSKYISGAAGLRVIRPHAHKKNIVQEQAILLGNTRSGTDLD